MTACSGLRLGVLEHLGQLLARRRHPRLEIDALHLELPGHVLDLVLLFRLHHRFGRLDIDQGDERLGELAHHLLADAPQLLLGQRLADRCLPLGDRLELAGVVGDPLVGQLGQGQRLDGGDLDHEVGRFVGALRRGRERQLVADAGPGEVLVEVVGHPALSQLVRPVLGVETHDLLTVAGGCEIEGEEVALLGGSIDVGE